MPESTPNYNLAKPSLTDAYDVGVQNINMDKIDAALADKADLIDGRIDTGQMPINVVPIATTSGSGSTYTANIEGITGLSKGLLLIVIPHISSTSPNPALNVNALGAKTISRRTSSSTASGNAGNTSAWLTRGVPLLVQYDGTCWVAVGQAKPDAADLHGTAPISHGGTGATGWTAYRLVYAPSEDALGQLAFPASDGSFLRQGAGGAPYWSTPAEVLDAIGAAPAAAGLPPGGTTNQVPVKASDEDYDIRWLDPNWGSGGGPHASTHATGGSDPITPAMIGAAPAPYYLSVTIQPSAWGSSGPPYIATMTRLSNVQTGDYMIAGLTPISSDVNDRMAEHNAWRCVSEITPGPAALYLRCLETRPDRPLSLILVGWHTTSTAGYCYLTGHASSSGGGTPDAHASTHAAGGSDPITPALIGAATSGHNHTGTYAPISHAATATTYGKATSTSYGHVKLSSATNSASGLSDGTAATPSAVKAAYDLAAGKADEGHNHDDRYALIGHTHSVGGASVEYKTITVPLDGWDAGVPCTQTISVAGVATTDYISAKYTSNAINTNERVADHAAYCCVTDGTPTPGGVLLTCWHERPTRDIRMILRVEHGGTSGYMAMTGQAQPAGGSKTANGGVITAEQTITVTELGFRPSMVTFVGGSGKSTVTQGYGAVSGDTTVARYADATGVGHTGTFAPTDDGFVLTVQGADTKTINVGWQAVGD